MVRWALATLAALAGEWHDATAEWGLRWRYWSSSLWGDFFVFFFVFGIYRKQMGGGFDNDDNVINLCLRVAWRRGMV